MPNCWTFKEAVDGIGLIVPGFWGCVVQRGVFLSQILVFFGKIVPFSLQSRYLLAEGFGFLSERGIGGAAGGEGENKEQGQRGNQLFHGASLFIGQVYHRDRVAGMGEEHVQKVGGGHSQAAGVQAGMAAELRRLVGLPVHQQPDPMLRVIGQS